MERWAKRQRDGERAGRRDSDARGVALIRRVPLSLRPSVPPSLNPSVIAAAAVWVAVWLAGCDRGNEITEAQDSGDLTPSKYYDLPPDKQYAAKTTTIYIPDPFADGALPAQAGPWASPVERLVHEGKPEYFAHQFVRAQFELKRPSVRVEWLPFDMWSPDFKALLNTSLHSQRSPAYYVARTLPDTMMEGWYADITDYLDAWPTARDHRHTRPGGSFNGRIYCIPGNEEQYPVIAYRKDYFKEAGIINEFGEPGPPSDWTWDDFRDYAKRLTVDTDGDGKTDRWGFVAEQHRFDMYYAECSLLVLRLYVPDKTGEYTWRFNADDPMLREGIRNFRAMYWDDQSVRTGVDFNWGVKDQEFKSGRVAMSAWTSAHPPAFYVEQPWYFGGDVETKDVLGMVPIPTNAHGVRYHISRTNMYGFNPLYKPDELKAAIDWYRSWVCGDLNAMILMSLKKKNDALGRPNPFPRYDLTNPYESEVKRLEPPQPGFFPKDFVNTYRLYRESGMFPTPHEFGLREPVQFNDTLNNMFSEILFAKPPLDDAELDRMLAAHTEKIQARCMTFKVDDDRPKLEAYYTALLDYSRRTMPAETYAQIAAFVEAKCR